MIVFQDEASLSNTASVSYKWGAKGIQPKIEQKQRNRERKTLFGCVDPITGIVTTDTADKGNTKTFFKFLVKVARVYPNRKVIMVVDNVRYHHAKRLKPILGKYKNRLELVYLPPYSPDLNPVERIWWYMRKKISHNRYLETMGDRITKFNELMKQFQYENILGKNLARLIVNI